MHASGKAYTPPSRHSLNPLCFMLCIISFSFNDAHVLFDAVVHMALVLGMIEIMLVFIVAKEVLFFIENQQNNNI